MTAALHTSHPPDLLRIGDLTRPDLDHLLDLAARMKMDPAGWCHDHAAEAVACYFAKPSTRTRVSFEAAAHRLGMLPIMLRPDELQLGRGEPIADTARVLSSYASAIVIRTFAQSELEEVAANASVPVINALSDAHHPCQALADLLTVREHFGSLRGRRLAFVGDGNNVAHSLIEAGAASGMQIAIATPPGYEPDAEIVDGARERASDGGAIDLLHDPVEAVVDADVVYTDVWVSMGEDEERRERLHDLAPYQVTTELMRRAKVDAIFLHCLPAHRGEEVTADVIDGPRSLVWQQAANRLPTEQALLYALVTGSWHPPGKRE
jgi:ornithine carbamoyltransferase